MEFHFLCQMSYVTHTQANHNHPLKLQNQKSIAVSNSDLGVGSTAQERTGLGATQATDVVGNIQTGPIPFAPQPYPVAWNVSQDQIHIVSTAAPKLKFLQVRCSGRDSAAHAADSGAGYRAEDTFFVFITSIHLNFDYTTYIDKHETTSGTLKIYQEDIRVTKFNCRHISCRKLAREQNLGRFNYNFKHTFLRLK
jgi:hypothetical protein